MAAVPQIPADQSILACVEYVDGDQVHVVRAFDGKHITEPLDLTRGVKAEIADVLNHSHDSKKMKWETLHGKDTERHPLGETMHDLALGVGAPDLTEPDDMETLMTITADFTPDAVAHEIPGGRNALAAKASPVQSRIDDDANYDNKDRFKVIYESPPPGPPGNGSTIMILLAAGVIFLAMYGK